MANTIQFSVIPRGDFAALGLPVGCDGAIRTNDGQIWTLASIGQDYTTWRSRSTDETLVLDRVQ